LEQRSPIGSRSIVFLLSSLVGANRSVRNSPVASSDDERGQTLVEYGLILSFVAMGIVASLVLFQQALDGAYQDIVTAVEELV
jgi:Flp pilus assembly pilin Flp